MLYICNICRERLYSSKTPFYRVTHCVKICKDCHETRTIDLDRWLQEEKIMKLNALFDCECEEIEQAYKDRENQYFDQL